LEVIWQSRRSELPDFPTRRRKSTERTHFGVQANHESIRSGCELSWRSDQSAQLVELCRVEWTLWWRLKKGRKKVTASPSFLSEVTALPWRRYGPVEARLWVSNSGTAGRGEGCGGGDQREMASDYFRRRCLAPQSRHLAVKLAPTDRHLLVASSSSRHRLALVISNGVVSLILFYRIFIY